MNIYTLALYTSAVVFPSRMPAGPHFVTQPILLMKNIPNIWHKSSTKHKEAEQIETTKTIMQTTPFITWKVLLMAQVAIFKEIFDQVRKDLDPWIVLFWTKTSAVSHYIYFI